MNHKLVLRWILRAQIFTLLVLVLMPTLVRMLGEMAGKLAYFAVVVAAVGLAWILHRFLDTIE